LLLFCGSTVWGQAAPEAHFLRGDSDRSQVIDLTDGIYTLGWLFLGGPEPPCLDAADTDDSGAIDIADAISLFSFLFLGSAPPAAPYPVFEGDPTADAVGCLGPCVEKTGDITSNQTWTSDQCYRLVSAVTVKAGATLTIEAGTTVLGDSATEGLLVVERGGRLVAVGTSTHPVVFTSDRPVGERGRGDWGGLIILGQANNNLPGKEGLAEGLENQFWGGGAPLIGNDDIIADDSGRLSYVRVEFGGTEISPDNEVNAISLFGVGSATQLDHIQVKYNLDDGYEYFGGSADLKYALAVGIGDDSFDYSFGWRGKGQFWVCQQRGDDADRGFEVDNSEGEFGATPLTRPTIANVTLIGDPDTNEGEESTQGMLIRRGAGTVVYNYTITGFKDAGIDIDDPITTENNPTNGRLVVDYGVIHNVGEACETGDSGNQVETAANGFNFTSCEFLRNLNTNNIESSQAPVVAPYNLNAPNFRPIGPALQNPFDPTSLDSFFAPAPYRGAVPPEGEGADWTQEPWVSYLQD
jgi:hypothetical protein